MILEDDMIRLHFSTGAYVDIKCQTAAIPWPPPKKLDFFGIIFLRTNMSQLTDDEAKTMLHISRGAEYIEDKNLV